MFSNGLPMAAERSRIARVRDSFSIFGIVLAVALASGCSQPSPKHSGTANDIAPRISGADRVVITNRLAGLNKRYQGFSYKVKGRMAEEIVEAVSFAPAHSPPVTDSLCDWDLQFWKGTNHLASVDYSGNVFRLDNREYVDDSGTLDKLSGELYRRITPSWER
jgi:hypothetical protein